MDNQIIKLYVRLIEGRTIHAFARIAQKGQTMTEYAMILSAIGVVVYTGYKSMGTAIKNVLTAVDGQL